MFGPVAGAVGIFASVPVFGTGLVGSFVLGFDGLFLGRRGFPLGGWNLILRYQS